MQKTFNSGAELVSALANIVNGNDTLPSTTLQFDDIVIEPSAAKGIKELNLIFNQSQIRDRGTDSNARQGLIALFDGPARSTKLMVTDLLAKQGGVDTTVINLSEVVSKFTNETIRNLDRIFDAAEKSGNILVFDEAEALFGKRSNVQDAHDRYANQEVTYFFKRAIESGNLYIISANNKSNLDDAFLRRIRSIISFPANYRL